MSDDLIARLESAEGVHLSMGEFTLCGDAFDIQDVEPDHGGFKATTKKVITCPRCARIIKACRGVRVAALKAREAAG